MFPDIPDFHLEAGERSRVTQSFWAEPGDVYRISFDIDCKIGLSANNPYFFRMSVGADGFYLNDEHIGNSRDINLRDPFHVEFFFQPEEATAELNIDIFTGASASITNIEISRSHYWGSAPAPRFTQIQTDEPIITLPDPLPPTQPREMPFALVSLQNLEDMRHQLGKKSGTGHLRELFGRDIIYEAGTYQGLIEANEFFERTPHNQSFPLSEILADDFVNFVRIFNRDGFDRIELDLVTIHMIEGLPVASNKREYHMLRDSNLGVAMPWAMKPTSNLVNDIAAEMGRIGSLILEIVGVD